VSADPWKDESGKGRWRGEYRGNYGYYDDRECKEEYRRGGCTPEPSSVVVEREISYIPEKIWRAFTQPQLIEEWLMKND
jgi:hypothetical protein